MPRETRLHGSQRPFQACGTGSCGHTSSTRWIRPVAPGTRVRAYCDGAPARARLVTARADHATRVMVRAKARVGAALTAVRSSLANGVALADRLAPRAPGCEGARGGWAVIERRAWRPGGGGL